MNCGILHGHGCGAPSDPSGCRLPSNHQGPHEFVANDGRVYQWETDVECDCESCMGPDPDFCTTYWPVEARTAAQAATDQAKG